MLLRDEILAELKRENSKTGTWHVSKTRTGVVWCDASSIAIGTVMEISGLVVEDAAWLQRKDNYNHISVAELKAVLKGINLGLKEMEVSHSTKLGELYCGREQKNMNKRCWKNDKAETRNTETIES